MAITAEINLNSNSRGYAERLASYHIARDKHRATIDKLESRVARLKNKWPECPSWIDELVKPIADALAVRYPEYYFSILGPFGLTSQTSIHASLKSAVDADPRGFHVTGSLTFRPASLEQGAIDIVDYTIDTGRFATGTLGDINGMNHPVRPCPSFDELCALIWESHS